jgi:starvation-inducible outer membrane lipoprotein
VEQSFVEYKEDYMHDSIDVRGYIKLVDYKENLVNDKIVKTWTLEAYNKDNPEFRATYIYSSEYGFVNFKYLLAGVEIEIDHYTTYHFMSIIDY